MVKKNTNRRQSAWVRVIIYDEIVSSDVFPGNRHTVQCLEPVVIAAESVLELAPEQRRRTVRRLDGDAGSMNSCVG